MCPQGATQLQLDGFSLTLIEDFSKSGRENGNLIKIRQE
jgi:hypothetical protein